MINSGTHQDKEYKFDNKCCLEKDNGALGREIDRIDKAELRIEVS